MKLLLLLGSLVRGRVRKVCTAVSSLQQLLFSKSRKFRFSIPVFTSDEFSNYVEVKISEIELGYKKLQILSSSVFINLSTPNDPYVGRTAPLTSKHCILYIYSTNIGTEYFKHALYSPFFLFKMQFVS